MRINQKLLQADSQPPLTDDEAFAGFDGNITAGDVRYAGQWRTVREPALEFVQCLRAADRVDLDVAAI